MLYKLRIWGQAQKLLLKAKADPHKVAEAIIGRDAEALDRILDVLQGKEPIEEEPPAEATAEVLPEIPGDTLRKAMKAFRRRMKLTRLDHESKLGVGPMTTGKAADFDSILPPQDFPPEVWKVLAARGELEYMGRGFYMLPKEPPALRSS